MSFDHTILKGTSSKIIEVVLRDSATGAGKTAVSYSDVTASYVREGGTRTAITLSAGSAGDAYSSGKWCEVDSTNCPGLYQLHLPNASLASGVDAVTAVLTASGVIDKMIRISLLDVDLRDSTNAGLSNLDAAISTRSTVAATDIVSGGAITTSGGAVSNVTLVATTTTNSDMVSVAGLSTFDHATDAVANVTTVGTVTNAVTTDSASRTASQADVSSLATAASISALNDFNPATDTVANVTTVGSVTNAVTTDAASRTASQADVSTLATSTDLAVVDGVVDAIKVVTDKLDDTMTLDGAVYQFTTNALENAPSGSGGGGDSKEDIYTYFTTSSRQDTFRATGFSTFDPATDTVTTDTASRNASKADVSSLATAASIASLNDFDPATQQVVASNMRGTDSALLASAVPTNFSSLLIDSAGHLSRVTLVDTTTANTDMVSVSGLASAADVATVDGVVDAIKVVTDKLDDTLASDGSLYQFTTNALENAPSGSGGGDSKEDIYTYFTTSSRQDTFRATGFSTFDPATQTVTTDSASRTASQADVSGLATESSIAALNDITAASVYQYFVQGTNADSFKADLTNIASQASIDTVDGIVDAIKSKTDQLTFTTPNSVDASATANVDESAIADAVLAGIGGNDITISSPVASDGTTITIIRGDDYSASDTRAITWTGDSEDQWPSLSGAVIKFTAKNNLDSLTVTPTVTQPTGTQAIRMELTSEDTKILSGRYKYDVQATLSSGRVITLIADGEMIVKQTYTDRP